MKKYITGIFIAAIFFIIQLFSLSSYGVDSDSPFHLLRGQAYLQYLLTGQQKFGEVNLSSPVLFAPEQRISSYTQNAWEGITDLVRPIAEFPNGKSIQAVFKNYQETHTRQSFYKSNVWNTDYYNSGPGHPPVSDILSAVTNRIFYEKLGLLGDIEAYHLYGVISATLAVFMVYLFTRHAFGEIAAIIATITLALSPFFFAESHFNVKDIPETAFFTISLVAFYFWVNLRNKLWFTVFTLSFFVALGTKLNIAFLPIILILWILTMIKTKIFKSWFSVKIIIYIALFIIVNIGLLIAIWPFLWTDTVPKIISSLTFYKEVGAKDFRIQATPTYGLPFGTNGLGLIMTLVTTPLITTLFASAGFLILIKSIRKTTASFLVLAWFSIPILRVTILSTDIFGTIRQFMEFLPAMAVMAGVGGNYLVNRLTVFLKRPTQFIIWSVIGIYIIYLAFIQISFHPNQNVFFNSLAGGVKGAWDKHILDWQTSNGNTYRQGVLWLNDHAPQNAKLAFLDGTMTSISPLWLRDDISIGSYFSGLSQKGEYIISVVYPNPPKVFPYLYLDKFLEPVYEIKVDGVTITKIWQNDPRYVRPEYRKTQTINQFPSPNFGKDNTGVYWQIDLGKKYQLVSIIMDVTSANCSKNSGIFFLDDFFLPYRLDKSDKQSSFLFPAEPVSFIRYYPLNDKSCFKNAKISNLRVLAQ